MEHERTVEDSIVHTYETAFCVFMAALAYLWRDNPGIVYPQILYMFLLLLALNLAAGLSLRLWPDRKGLSAAFILGNCAAITAILRFSGGADSNLWVLYLLPIFSVCLLLERRETLLITGGAISFNAALAWFEAASWTAAPVFALLVKTAVFVLTAAIARTMSDRDRTGRLKVERGRAALRTVERSLHAERERLSDSERLADVGLMSSSVVHGLNNAFTALLGFIDIALQSQNLSPDLQDDLEGARRCAVQGRDMVSAFQALSRAGRRSPEPCDVGAILATALGAAQDVLSARGARLLAPVAPKLPPVRGDKVHLARLMRDLAACAAGLTGRGETLSVRLASSEDFHLTLTLETAGPDLDEESLRSLLDPGADAGSPRPNLRVCSEIAVQHHGRLALEAVAEGRARFTLALPIWANRASADPAARSYL